jgi:hypothetical protein
MSVLQHTNSSTQIETADKEEIYLKSLKVFAAHRDLHGIFSVLSLYQNSVKSVNDSAYQLAFVTYLRSEPKIKSGLSYPPIDGIIKNLIKSDSDIKSECISNFIFQVFCIRDDIFRLENYFKRMQARMIGINANSISEYMRMEDRLKPVNQSISVNTLLEYIKSKS